MDFQKEYNDYPYKRLFNTAMTFNYPTEVISKLIDSLQGWWFIESISETKETYVKMLLVSLNHRLDYMFTTEDEMLDNVIELKLSSKKNSILELICDNVIDYYVK